MSNPKSVLIWHKNSHRIRPRPGEWVLIYGPSFGVLAAYSHLQRTGGLGWYECAHEKTPIHDDDVEYWTEYPEFKRQ